MELGKKKSFFVVTGKPNKMSILPMVGPKWQPFWFTSPPNFFFNCVYLVCKEKLNLLLKVLRLLVKVRWIELGGTDFLLTDT